MDDGTPFIGSEALASGALTPYELRRHYRAVMPNVYMDRRIEPTLRQRTQAAWLWSGRSAVVAGLSASALHGAKWVGDGAPVELIWGNARSPRQVVTRADFLAAGETRPIAGMSVTTPARTAFDIGRRGPLGDAVARVDSLLSTTRFAVDDVIAMAGEHVGARGLGQLRRVLDLADAGAESPKETWLRLLLIGAGYPRPRTQIPVISPDGRRRYYLDMGWEERRLAVEYDGDHHRSDPVQFAGDIRRLADIDELGWGLVRVVARNSRDDVLRRVQRAWDRRSTLR
ncbi:hypothetical protein ASD37_26750 [Mycobacterium sp. Root135]|uniref:endonuclease domain-containing protein n=1 Tax=Mycobacterium sp. Root135 TaxID=1736457 RepID=UPI0006F7D801|nr:hypothetical protein [Mycobacterium sp. Root135]KQY03112.1 hypothetical protein ASD37_26750 [Mycobacterium sp. Root135]